MNDDAVPIDGARAERQGGEWTSCLAARVHSSRDASPERRAARSGSYDIHLLLRRRTAADLDRFASLAVSKERRRHLRPSARARLGAFRHTVTTRCSRDSFAIGSGAIRGVLCEQDADGITRCCGTFARSADGATAYGCCERCCCRHRGTWSIGYHLGPSGVLLLPALYLHRGVYGAFKILAGRK